MNDRPDTEKGTAERPSSGRGDLVVLLPSRLKLLSSVVAEALQGTSLVTIHGKPGTGKSVFARALAHALRRHRIASIIIPGANSRPLEVQHAIDAALGIQMMNEEQPWRLRAAMAGRPAFAIVCDDADLLPAATLHYLGLLHRLLNVDMVRLHVILIGGTSLQSALRQSGLAPLFHFACSYVISPLDEGEGLAYLARTLQSQGQVPRQVLPGAAAAELLGLARGIPRDIDALANSALEHFERSGHRMSVQSKQRGWREAMIASLAILVVGGVIGGEAGFFSGPADGSNPAMQGAELDHVHEAHVAEQRSEATEGTDPLRLPLPPDNSQGSPDAEALGGTTDEVPPAQAPLLALNAGSIVMPLAQPSSEPESARLAPRATPRLGGPGLALMVKEGDTIRALYAKVYRGLTPPPYAAVLAMNRTPMKPGAILVFPEPPGGWRYPDGAMRARGAGAL